MKKIIIFFTTILIFSFFITNNLSAQDDFKISNKIGGTIQAWTSYGEIHNSDTNSLGWGLRRVRLRSYSTFGKYIKGYIQVELTNPKLLDARIEYLISKEFTIRAGRFVGAGVRAGGLTSHTKIDITERPLSAIRFGQNTIGSDYRDYGVDFVGKFGDIKANLTLHNGNGNANIRNRKTGAGPMNNGFAISSMVTFKPKNIKGLEIGGYYGMGNKQINEYNAYNLYVYYEPKPLRVKAELIGFSKADEIKRMGYYLFGAYGFAKNWEALARFEVYDQNTDADDDQVTLITLGATYSVFKNNWAAGRITAAYAIINEGEFLERDNNVFQLVMQLVF